MVDKELELIKNKIPHNTYRTIIGQIEAGDVAGAQVGVERIKVRLAKEDARHDNRSSK